MYGLCCKQTNKNIINNITLSVKQTNKKNINNNANLSHLNKNKQ